MGVEYIERKNEEIGSQECEPIYLPAASDCDAQVRLQFGDYSEKRQVIDGIFDPEIEKGTRDFFIYCNSLSGAFDFDSYMKEKSDESGCDIRIYTPLQVYREIGRNYRCIGVMAANNLSAHAIEKALKTDNPDMYVVGSGNMAVVRAIEDGVPPKEIVENCALGALAQYMQASGAEALLLGCTHFPYFAKELSGVTDLTFIDPADMMFEAMINRPE